MAMLVPTSKPAALATAASIAASAVLVRTLAADLIPASIQDRLSDAFTSLLAKLSSSLTVTIDEFDGPTPNLMYKAAESYLATKLTPSTRHIRVIKHDDDDNDDDNDGGFDVTIARGEQVVDCFEGIEFTWQSNSKESLPRRNSRGHHGHYADKSAFESRSFELTLHKKHKEVALKSYLPYVMSKAKAIKEEAKTLKLYTNNEDYWDSVRLRHPATFETVAMEMGLKKAVMEDLARFVTRKEYYKRVGKAWKRGYLLYGPPGTGKSSLVAAMANFLRFDVYDLELTEVRNNTALRTLLVGTANRSILVVEDIDCAGDIGTRGEKKKKKKRGSRNNGNSDSDNDDNEKVTLSGLLNFVDGLWSSCGDERIIVFTTNHKDRLDPALLRPGRMDMHIHMSYCTPTGFRILASNYHSLDYHPLFEEVERLIREVEITPAEVAEEMMKTDDVEVSLRRLIKILEEKKVKNEESEQLRKVKRERRNTDCQTDPQIERDSSNSGEN